MKIGIVGYGTGGKNFHAPFIAAAQGLELAGIVARAPATIAKVQADFPDVPVYPSLSAMLAAGIDIVTITTPPHTRRELVLEAIEAGVSVIADKPFAPDAKTGRELAAAAKVKGVVLGAYHNRRFDADMQTLKKVIEQQRLGKVWRLHNRMDLDEPHTLEGGPTGGLLRDMGSHLVDQAIWLLGPVKSVYAQLDIVEVAEGPTDASFYLTLTHANGSHSYVSSSKINHLAARELRVYGEKGSFTSYGTDVQVRAIFAGQRPADDLAGWGYEAESNWGSLNTAQGSERVPSEQGAYHAYYEAFADAVRNGSQPPVTAEQAIEVLAVLDAAFISAKENRVVDVK
ncbi:dehydrogenase [Pantoea rodasii]|uniref:Dehydrogenase n=1 Tax=Pantoea rodasii TaxID=1076549 RepID=A0A2M9WJ75_9GAMM|nr:Gfo/Idh/MocA family oxidoreductase [Pantoea rodasii]ORM61839.1 dehydrogenase [Pantoea rodasii]PJZ07559.1 dehydrogenase [Pantoea rodasii]